MKDGKFNGGNPAYPVATNDSIYAGLTKRELFAAMIMQGIASNDFKTNVSPCIYTACVRMADALLAELEKTK